MSASGGCLFPAADRSSGVHDIPRWWHTVILMRTHGSPAPLAILLAALVSTGVFLLGIGPAPQAQASRPTPERVLPAASGICPNPPAVEWTMALRGYFTAPNTTSLDDQRAWDLLSNSLEGFQEALLRGTRCAIGIRVDLYPERGTPWTGGTDLDIQAPTDTDTFLAYYDIVAHRFPIEDGQSPYLGAASGRLQFYPVSTSTEAPKQAVGAAPYIPVLLHETLHTLTGWAKAQGVLLDLPPGDVHAAPQLPHYAQAADMTFYQDYLRGMVPVNDRLTGLPPSALVQAGTPTSGSVSTPAEPGLTLVVLGAQWYAWSASSAPLRVTYPTSEGQATRLLMHGTDLQEGMLPASESTIEVCVEQGAQGPFAGERVCREVPSTHEYFPEPPKQDEPQHSRARR